MGELLCKLKPVIFHEVKRAVSKPGLYKGVMLAIPSKAHFGALHYWGQQGFTRQLKTKKLLRLSGLKNHNSFCVIVGGFFQKYCIRRYRKEQEKLYKKTVLHKCKIDVMQIDVQIRLYDI